jgi:hypothetical protein
MSTLVKRLLWAAALTMALAATANAERPPLHFAVVTGATSSHRLHGKDNLYPWDVAQADEVIISNSCGFAAVTYHRLLETGKVTPWKALGLLGEWCVDEFKRDGLQLVAYRDWEGKSYIWSVAEIRTDEAGRRYIDDEGFMVSAMIEVEGPEVTRVYLDEIPETKAFVSAGQ